MLQFKIFTFTVYGPAEYLVDLYSLQAKFGLTDGYLDKL